ncbi:ribulose-phosphate 3 epimerase family protein, partial [Toxoplasma gondii MAS]
MRLASPGHH